MADPAATTGGDPLGVVMDWIMHHVADSHEWHLPFGIHIHLPSFLTLHTVMLFIGAAIMILLFGVLFKKDPKKAPSGITNLLEVFVIYIRDEISIAFLGEDDGRKMTPLFCNLFFFILILNLIGLIPLFSTATGNINVTAGLATTVLGFMIFGTMIKNGVGGFFGAFIPHGIPLPVLFIVVPLEFIGMFIKASALTIRLFANMFAGHVVIFSMVGLIVAFGAVAMPILVLALGISLLEVFIAFLQAYIFTLLSAIFIGMMYHPAH